MKTMKKHGIAAILFALLLLAALLLEGCLPAKNAAPSTPSGSAGSSDGPTVPTSPATPSATTPEPTPTPFVPVREQVTLTEAELLDKLEGGWIGQMVGVVWGAPTEFCYAGQLIPAGAVPAWNADKINDAFGQDDCYVEIPFLEAMEKKGAFCDPSVIAKTFKNSEFALWHANYMGRLNLRNGIEYPDSGSYLNNYHCDDIDWQIECDFLGMMYPGQVNEAARRAFELGHIMNYGDGVYGGVFVTAMHAAAFTASSIDEIVTAGVSVIPEGTLFRALIDDVLESYRAGDSFETNWNKLQRKWGGADICPELPGQSNIDAKLNSGYILLGLLYGEGDFAKTIILSMRCGQDSDCNPSSAASILGSFYGASGLDEQYKSALRRTGTKFSFTRYTYESAVKLNFKLMKEVLGKFGGSADESGTWTFEKDCAFEPVPFEQVPDGVYAYLLATLKGNTLTFSELTPFGKNERPVGYTIDTGDGTVFKDVLPASYIYAKAGTYVLTVTVTGDKGSVTKVEREYAVSSDYAGTLPGYYIVCDIQSPAGGGNKNVGTICDGYVPKGNDPDSRQYDTYVLGDPHGNPGRPTYIGYVYTEEKTVSSVVFTEGKHFGDGGWFAGGDIRVEVLTNGAWTAADCTVSPAYPRGNATSVFGSAYETYTFTFASPVNCTGVRLAGTAGGSKTFISVGELAVS